MVSVPFVPQFFLHHMLYCILYITKACPLKADKVVDYSGDYGFPEGNVYAKSNISKSDVEEPGMKAAREAKELTRANTEMKRTNDL